MSDPTYHDGLTHIVGTDDDARVRAVAATQGERVSNERIKVKAICGYEYTPTRDPANFPLCPKCEARAKQDRVEWSGKHR